MKYTCEETKYAVEPKEFNKNSGKEMLQYAVGGLLYMPASNTKIVAKIVSGEYSFIKSMVLDLEDSLGDDMVKYGQRNIAKLMKELNAEIEKGTITIDNVPLVFIRIREANQITETLEILGNNIQYITGFNIPKFDAHSCKDFIETFTAAMEKVKRKYNTDLYMMPIIESKNALYRQLRMENLLFINDALRPIANNVLNIRVGGADFCHIFGIRRKVTQCIFDIGAVADCLNDIVNVFGKSYIVSGPVWEYFYNKEKPDETQWIEGLKHELEIGALSGFIGKTCIHPKQLKYVQEANIVSLDDYNDAISILGMNTNVVGVQKSTGGNRMNEAKTHSKWARKIIGMANIYGVIQEE